MNFRPTMEGGYRQVVLGRRKHFGRPKTQLAMFA